MADADRSRQEQNAAARAWLSRGSALLRSRLFGQNEKVVQNFLSECVVVEQLATVVGNHEFVGLLAVRDREAALLVVFDKSDHFEFVFLPVRRLDDEDIVQFDFSLARRVAVCRVDGGLLLQCT